MAHSSIQWPEGKEFAFTIVDDTDVSVLPRIKPVYDFLADNGFRTTKTVWPLRARGPGITGGDCLEDEDYRNWVLELRAQGFEIAIHGVADETSERQRVIEGLDRFRDYFGHDPSMHVNHVGQGEAIYWGSARLNGLVRAAYWLYRKYQGSDAESFGHRPESDKFWGDVCRERIRYVRNLVYPDINTLKADPLMPYHDARRPFVKYWYSASYGSGLENFLKLLSEANQDRLRREGGACIVYTHLGSTFFPLDAEFRRLMSRLARLPGWFVPASTLLDFLGEQRGWREIGAHSLASTRMQYNWLFQQYTRKMA
jgi:hypothetical protein